MIRRTNLVARYLLLAGLSGAAATLSCSGDPAAQPAPIDPPPADAGSDVGERDAARDADCPTCDWFPAQCSRGALCAVNATLEPQKELLAIGTHDAGVTAVGTYGAVLDRGGDSAWTSGDVGTNDALRAITTHGGELWAASSLDGVFVRSLGDGGTAWTHLTMRGGTYFGHNRPINGLFGDPQRTWAWAAVTPVCAGGFFDTGVALTRLRREPTRLAVEDVIRHDGFTSKCAGLNAIDGTDGAVWTVGDLGIVYELTDLDAPTPQIAPKNSGTTRTLRAVWAPASGHVWAAGMDGTLVHRAPGQDFVVEQLPTTAALHAVRGTSASDIWVAGEEATVLHFDGTTWSRIAIAGLGDRRPTLRAIAAVTPDRVWVAGEGVLLALATAEGRAP